MDINASRALLIAASLIGLSTIANAQTSTPKLNVESTCKSTTADDKSMGLALPQSYDSCMRDETTAQQQLGPVWPATPEAVRTQCYGEAVAGGIESYVDLLTCIQMAGYAQAAQAATTLRGGGKNRNKKQ
jgi:hypothetical protein